MLANILILLPFLVAVIVNFLPLKSLKTFSIFASLGLLFVAGAAYVTYKGDPQSLLLTSDYPWISSLGSKWFLDLDGMSILMVLLATLITPIIFLTISQDAKYDKGFYALVWMMVAAMIGVFTAKDGLLFYVFWELALIPIYLYVLSGVEKTEVELHLNFLYILCLAHCLC